jgi:hypothetical protein
MLPTIFYRAEIAPYLDAPPLRMGGQATQWTDFGIRLYDRPGMPIAGRARGVDSPLHACLSTLAGTRVRLE